MLLPLLAYFGGVLTILGSCIHAPEFAFEETIDNVEKAVADLGIGYPVAIDNNYAIWRSFKNHYWPARYFIRAQGRIRRHHFGEGGYDESEHVIQQLLAEAGHSVAADVVAVKAEGAQQASAEADVKSPETYVGASRGENFVSPGAAVLGAAHTYAPGTPGLNEWGLKGSWTVGADNAALNKPNGGILTASMPATSTSCSGRGRTASPCVSGSPSVAPRPATVTALTSAWTGRAP